jgi:hypothetical protein
MDKIVAPMMIVIQLIQTDYDDEEDEVKVNVYISQNDYVRINLIQLYTFK